MKSSSYNQIIFINDIIGYLDLYKCMVLSEFERNELSLQAKPENFIAKRLAAKMALINCLSKKISTQHLTEISISHDLNGKPFFTLSSQLRQILKPINKMMVSIADEKKYAFAYVRIEESDGDNCEKSESAEMDSLVLAKV